MDGFHSWEILQLLSHVNWYEFSHSSNLVSFQAPAEEILDSESPVGHFANIEA